MNDKQVFENIINSYPNTASYVCFARLIEGKGYNRSKINRLLNQLVDKNDYAKREVGQLLDYLTEYSKK